MPDMPARYIVERRHHVIPRNTAPVVALLIVVLSVASARTLLCAVCADAATQPASGCHEHTESGATVTLQSGDMCEHDIVSSAFVVNTGTPQKHLEVEHDYVRIPASARGDTDQRATISPPGTAPPSGQHRPAVLRI